MSKPTIFFSHSSNTALSSYREMAKITFTISPYNLEKSFDLFIDFCLTIPEIKWIHVDISLSDEYYFNP